MKLPSFLLSALRCLPVMALATTGVLCGVSRAAERPHIILIMVDDMGFSDLGYHGSEIETPNIDALARGGVRFSQFYNSGRCCPTRATLMTGLHPHQVGIGHMTQPPGSDRGKNRPPAYQGYLNRNCVTLGEALKPAGYATLMAGKWHLGHNDQDRWPLQRGFEKYFGCISGATRFFFPEHPRGMTFGNEDLEKPESTTEEAFYTTDAFTDFGIRFIREHRRSKNKTRDNPFFLYLAYTAPHWPLQAFEDDIAKYRGKYKIGWDKLREQRLKRQVELGLIDPKWKLSPRTDKIPAWDTLDEKKQDEMDLKMAVYAAMIDRVDQNVGKLVGFLKESGVYDDTLILFLSDNGGCQEGGMFGRGNFYDVEKRNQESANSYGEAWANASNTPFRLYKHFVHEGGAATPFFMHWPAKIAARKEWFSDPAQLIDLMPTLLDVSGATYPDEFNGNKIPALHGVSLRPAFDGEALGRKAPIFVEHENNAFVREGKWKLVGRGVAGTKGTDVSKWELYDLEADRTETNNLVASEPQKFKQLAGPWQIWADHHGVYPKEKTGAAAQPEAKREPKAEENPPQVFGKPFTVTAEIRQKNPNGVVLSHGGVQFGYALHFVKGKPTFSLRNKGQLTELIAKESLSGKFTIEASLNAETMSLSVDGTVVATRKSPGLLTGQPAIGLYLGEDFKDPVGKYKIPNRFNGKITSFKVTVEIPKVTMRTKWGETIDEISSWRDYPRPALRRKNWTRLNGPWDYAITAKSETAAPAKWEGTIRVPFAIEAPLSGVERRLSPDEALWYRRTIEIVKKEKRRYLLNFEAVDYQSTVWVNGVEVGSHTGGNLPFSFDITGAAKEGENTITVRVTDSTDAKGSYQLHGKQRLNPKGIWYTPVSGIWQSVWMEEVPERYIESLKLTWDAPSTLMILPTLAGKPKDGEHHRFTLLDGSNAVSVSNSNSLRVTDAKLWSPNNPHLYILRAEILDADDRPIDSVLSYAGLRTVGKEKDAEGHWRFTLNGKPIFHWGTLDQGWWPDGLLTPPSEGAMRSDIEFLKAAGFNTIRKHIKVEPRIYYYLCDMIGMMVWQDQVSAMADNPEWTRLQPEPETRTWPAPAHKQFMTELKGMMDGLHNHPCIVQWVPFNERWGQHQTMEVGKWTADYDRTRHVNVASGGNFFPVGDIVDAHAYPHPAFPFDQDGGRFDGYIKVMGEFGGHGFPVEGHLWSKNTRNWGYGGLPKDKAEWLERYRTSVQRLAELKKQGIAAGIYTQTTDVEGEINGLLTYDRKVQKIPAEQLRSIAKGLLD